MTRNDDNKTREEQQAREDAMWDRLAEQAEADDRMTQFATDAQERTQ